MVTRLSVFLILSLFVLVRSPAAAVLDPVDFVALQSIRKSLSDLPGSDFFSQWDFTGDPCSFPGVFCAGDQVVALALGDPRAGTPGLTGRLDPAIGRLSALSELSLVPGRVIGQIPDSISLCSSLRFLALSGNFLSGPIPPSFASLRHLRTIDFSFNILSGEIPPSISSLPALSNLVLCHNHLYGKIPSFPSSSPLLRLDVKHNNLSGELPALPLSIRYLAVSSNGLSGRIDGVIPQLTDLAYLDLSMNIFTGPIPATIFNLPLSSLRLQRNKFAGAVVPPTDVKIPEVDLSYNRLSGAVSPLLAAVGRLYLNNNRFTGELPARFAERLEAAGMEVLYLQHNFLSGMQMSPAAEIPMTTSLCLQYNCMVPPVDAPCPLKAGRQKTRPVNQCPEWRV
ncbi:LRR receptor-like serine/threonine-protein kinase ERL1 [Dendrobium catenatum]|uniref:LRR receptor-like serine/threonine-protein kinase ERL1 n=1 Tax=Dendrobium catenatum TaxID=906689 RepID=A0A2I0WY31_9ASPA|nr:LRR receptor-like serine/threonine-protein kinase ERL1 [Dendrobium catenatum]PKU80556.1 LRR receptor-like serine/threonine-protein kinase ERL1 [Dendrobium catenatum]